MLQRALRRNTATVTFVLPPTCLRFDYQGSATAKPSRVYLVVFPREGGAKGFLPQGPPGVRYVHSPGQQN
ncbi:hypothetical protein ADK97_05585 [Streptomyces sp. H021]|nr:hypothetical protein ADK97_05585 [Streptomyces sp. H021]